MKSPFFDKVLAKITAASSPSKVLAQLFPVRLNPEMTSENEGSFHVHFQEGGYGIKSKGLMIKTIDDRAPTEVDGMLAMGLFLIEQAEYRLALYQTDMFCKELHKMIDLGSMNIDPNDEISEALFTLVMNNASNSAFEENQVPEGVTVQ